MRALNRKLLRDFWRLRGQALAIAIVTAAGTAAFATLLGTLYAMEDTQAAYYERYRFADIFENVRRAPDEVAHEIARIDGVRKVTTRIVHNVVLDIPGTTEPINGLTVSAPRPGQDSLNDVYLRRGRMVQPSATNEVVLSEPFAEANRLTVGSTFHAILKGTRSELKVVGIGLSPEYIFFGVPGAMVPDDRRFGVMWMDHDALAAVFDYRNAFDDVLLSVAPTADRQEVIDRVDAILAPYGGIGGYARKDHVSHATLNGDIEQLRSSVRIAAPIFLGIVAFLLHMLMMRHIETEREHIGVLKAFGYGNGTVAWHYMKLVLTIVAIGVVVGTVGGVRLGRVVTETYAANYHFPFLLYSLTPSIFVQAAGVQLGAALVGALASVRKAIELPPAVAMRPPPPPVYRRTFLERVGLRIIHDQPTRMILRHIIRWPIRSALTTLGIAFATAMLLAPMGGFDSAKNMVQVHFFRAERQDLTVAFAQVRPQATALQTLDNAPGVLHVEPFRAAPANLTFGLKKRRIAVLGRPAVNELSRPLLANLDPMVIPPAGIVISSSLASWLGAGAGDILDLQFVEGHRPHVQLPVTGISESYVGLTFFMLYMDMDRLNALLGDGDAITGVHLRVDPLWVDELYNSIKNTPSITGGVSHSAQFAAMQRIMAQTTQVTLINLLFAAIIVFGVVYTSASVSLSERSQELATMQMLGFTRWEVAYILLGELAVLTAVAVPLGLGAGYALAWKMTEGISNEIFRLPLHMQRFSFGYTIASVLTAVALSSMVVAVKMVRLDLIGLLKTRE